MRCVAPIIKELMTIEHQSVSLIRAYVVAHTITGDVVSHEFDTEQAAQEFIEQIQHAESDNFEIVPIA